MDINKIVSIFLRITTLIAALLVLGGGIGFLYVQGKAKPAYHSFQSDPYPLRTLPETFRDALVGEPTAFLQLGIVFLLFIPFLRVLLCGLAFLFQKNWRYAWISLFLFLALLYSL